MAYAQGNGIFQVDFIFLGDVTAMRNKTNGSLPHYEVTFSVRDRWKGSIPDIVSVRTNAGEIACGYKFEKHNSYLVFAHWDEQRQELATYWCDLTRTEAKAKGAIGVLNRLTKRASAAAWHDGGGMVNDRFGSAAVIQYITSPPSAIGQKRPLIVARIRRNHTVYLACEDLWIVDPIIAPILY